MISPQHELSEIQQPFIFVRETKVQFVYLCIMKLIFFNHRWIPRNAWAGKDLTRSTTLGMSMEIMTSHLSTDLIKETHYSFYWALHVETKWDF